MKAKIIAPNELSIDVSTAAKLQEIVEDSRNSDDWGNFSTYASYMKLLFPNQQLNLDTIVWHELKKQLNYFRNDNDTGFLFHASELKILASEKVEFTENGLEITMPKPKSDISQPIPPIPEVKKF